MNYTNPGAISHNEILELYKSYIDPDFSWKNFSLEEQAKVIIAPRSNNLLDTARVSARVQSPVTLTAPLSTFAVSHGSVNSKRRMQQCSPGRLRLKCCAADFECSLMLHALAQIEGEFPEILGIRESLIKHVFEPAAQQVCLRPFLHFPQALTPQRLSTVTLPSIGYGDLMDLLDSLEIWQARLHAR